MKIFTSILAGVGVLLIALGISGVFSDKTAYAQLQTAEISANDGYQTNGYVMHSLGGMMGGRDNVVSNYSNHESDETNALSAEEAYTIGSEYVKANFTESVTISTDAYEMHGDYRFHLIDNDVVVGMVSVNRYTGDVWATNHCAGRQVEIAA
jgi:hypothetical protein